MKYLKVMKRGHLVNATKVEGRVRESEISHTEFRADLLRFFFSVLFVAKSGNCLPVVHVEVSARYGEICLPIGSPEIVACDGGRASECQRIKIEG